MQLNNKNKDAINIVAGYVKNKEESLKDAYKRLVMNSREGSFKQEIYEILKDEEEIINTLPKFEMS